MYRLALNSRMLHTHLPVLESYILPAGLTRNIPKVSINFLTTSLSYTFLVARNKWLFRAVTSEWTKNHKCPFFPAPPGLKKEFTTLLKNITFITWMVRNQSCPKRTLENISKIYDRQNWPKKGINVPGNSLRLI